MWSSLAIEECKLSLREFFRIPIPTQVIIVIFIFIFILFNFHACVFISRSWARARHYDNARVLPGCCEGKFPAEGTIRLNNRILGSWREGLQVFETHCGQFNQWSQELLTCIELCVHITFQSCWHSNWYDITEIDHGHSRTLHGHVHSVYK